MTPIARQRFMRAEEISSSMTGRQTAKSLLVLLGGVFLAGCSIHARHLPPPAAPVAPRTIDLLYVSDRGRTELPAKPCPAGERPASRIAFGVERSEDGSIAYGIFPIRVPLNRELGKLLPYKRRPVCVAGDGHPLYRAGPEPLGGEEEFVRALAARLDTAPRREILIFLHGFNFEFDEAALWAAQLHHDAAFEGVTILFSWPSHRSRWRYLTDEENIVWSTPHLKALLVRLHERFPAATMHVVAHSMGARAVLRALSELATEQRAQPPPRFGQVVFAAPDVDADVFRQSIPPALGLAQRVTLYASATDEALLASGRVHRYPRAGDSGNDLVLIPGLDTVDVSAFGKSRHNHAYFLESRWVLADLHRLLRDGVAPSERFGLAPVPLTSGTYWKLRP